MQKIHAGKILPAYCVYGIRNLRTKRVFVGSSDSAGKTFKQHCSALERGTHQCAELQQEFNELKEGEFAFEVIQSVARSKKDTLPVLKQKWMKKFLKEDSGSLYNIDDFQESLVLPACPMAFSAPKCSNPNPVRTEKVIKNMFQAVSDLPSEPLAKNNVYVKLGQSVYDYLQALPQGDRINLVRTAITKAVDAHQARQELV
jgi:hypothetical protein